MSGSFRHARSPGRTVRAAFALALAAGGLGGGLAGVPASASANPAQAGNVSPQFRAVSAARPLRLAAGTDTDPGLVNRLQVAVDQQTGAAPAPAVRMESGPPAAPYVLQSGQGTSRTVQMALGSDNAVAPPDPDVAAGGPWVVETTNESMFIYGRSGGLYPDPEGVTCPAPAPAPGNPTYSVGDCNQIDLNNFIDANGWTLSDPRVLYDPGAGQFYLSLFLTTTPSPAQSCLPGYEPAGDTCSVVFVMHTVDGDPTGAWSGYYFYAYSADVITDQPMIGFSADKIGVSWDEEGSVCGATNWCGDENFVMSTSLFLADAADPVIYPQSGVLAAPETQTFSVDPVTDLSSGTALYFISNNATTDLPHDGTTPDVVIAEFSGNTTATISESDHAADIIASLAPPAAPQSGTAAYTIDTDDDRIDIGVWSGGAIWTAFDELCAEGSVNVACIRYVEIDTASMTVTQDINFGIPGAYVYYPSLGVDPAGDFLSTFTTSSTTTDPTVMAVGMPAGQSSLSNPVTVVAGSGPYDDSDATDGVCSVSNDPVTHTTACRYGDYAGGAMDPLHPDDLWFANEVQLSTTATDWGTEIGRLTYGAPTISGFTPSAGPTTGGVTVTVSGSDFAAGATFSFGGAATTISGLTPDSFTFVPPGSSGSPHATGSVSGAVTDSRGTSNSVSYTYLPPSRYEPMTPYRICDTRSAASLGYTDQCNASGPAPLGQGGVMTVQVEGYAPPGYGGPTVPGTATAVVLNVTAVTPTVGTYLSVYPDGTAVPNASSLNTNAGQTIANLVTIPMETDGSVDVYNSLGVVDVVVDVQGYYAAASGGSSGLYHPLSPPVRICDSRAGQGTACNDGVSDDPLGLTNVRQVTVWGGTGGIPTNGTAEAAVLNLTGVSGTAGTYLTVYPTDAAHTCSAPPGTSSLNLSAQTNQANRVVVPVDATNGAVCVYNSLGSINFILDVNGWYGNGTDTGGAAFYPISPTRICDTRSGSSTECAGQTLGQGGIDLVAVEGSGPLPSSGIVGLVANVTAVSGTAGTFVTVWPAGTTRTTSDINANAGVNIANLDVVAIPGDGDVDVYNSLGTINVVIDALGWFA